MKTKALPVTWLLMAVLILTGGLSLPRAPFLGMEAAQAQPPDAGTPALIQVRQPSARAGALLRAGGIVATTRLVSAEGPCLLAVAPGRTVAALRSQGLDVAVLDADATGATYYLARALALPAGWQAHARLILDAGGWLLLRATPQAAQALAGPDARLRPLALSPAATAVARNRSRLALDPDPHVAAMLAGVETETLRQMVGDLSGAWPAMVGGEPYTITTRNTYSGTPIQKATQYAGEHLAALGLDVEYETWNASRPPNVIGELPSPGTSDDVAIICAHLDDMPGSGAAPGADDNASGSAAVLAAAEVLTRYAWTCDLRFALWTGEEQGLLGSRAYAQRASGLDENILGVVNLDMIAHNSAEMPAPIVDVHADSGVPASESLADLFGAVIDAYGLELQYDIWVDNWVRQYSDSWAFIEQDYSAILAIEDDDDFTDYYHTSMDLLSTLNLAYYTQFARAAVGTLAHLGCFPQGSLAGTVSDTWTEAPIAGAAVRLEDGYHAVYTTTAGALGAYSLVAMAGSYTATVSAPGYQPATVGGVAVLTGTVATRDLALVPLATWHVSPASVTARLAAGGTSTQTLWIENDDGGALAWSLQEMAGGQPGDLPWLAATPVSGTLAGGSGQPVTVTLATAGLVVGVYAADLRVQSGDALAPGVDVPVTLTVLPAQPGWRFYLPLVRRGR